MRAMTIHKQMNDSVWQREAPAKCKQPFEELMTKMRKLEVSDFDALVALTTGAPKNIQDPVLSRWGSVLDTCDIFVEYYVLIYFFAIAVKQFSKPTKNSSSPKYLYQVACSLISLMFIYVHRFALICRILIYNTYTRKFLNGVNNLILKDLISRIIYYVR